MWSSCRVQGHDEMGTVLFHIFKVNQQLPTHYIVVNHKIQKNRCFAPGLQKANIVVTRQIILSPSSWSSSAITLLHTLKASFFHSASFLIPTRPERCWNDFCWALEMWHNPTVERWGYKDKLIREEATIRGSLRSNVIQKAGVWLGSVIPTQCKSATLY
jgi:hypothetical protein